MRTGLDAYLRFEGIVKPRLPNSKAVATFGSSGVSETNRSLIESVRMRMRESQTPIATPILFIFSQSN
jgi:hypothetical protein